MHFNLSFKLVYDKLKNNFNLMLNNLVTWMENFVREFRCNKINGKSGR